MSPVTGGGGLWGRLHLKFNGPVILVGFTRDPRAHKGGVLWQAVPAGAGRGGGRKERMEGGGETLCRGTPPAVFAHHNGP